MQSSIPSPASLKSNLKPSDSALSFIQSTRKHCHHILKGQEGRKVLIVGPCSIHDTDAALDYALRLKELSREVGDHILLLMRVYVEKARTHSGWKGLIYDPDLNGLQDLNKGLGKARQLLVQLSELGVGCATEFVDPLITSYLEDLICWGFIGARTSSSQPHRQLASSLEMPIGFKNTVYGCVDSAICGVKVAKEPQSFLYPNEEGCVQAICSEGNPSSHIVLRGSLDNTNYARAHVISAKQKLHKWGLSPKVMVDCSHGNARGAEEGQYEAFMQTLENMREDPDLFGLMLESFLKKGKQPLSAKLDYGKSITDTCLDWEMTKELILRAHGVFSSVCVS